MGHPSNAASSAARLTAMACVACPRSGGPSPADAVASTPSATCSLLSSQTFAFASLGSFQDGRLDLAIPFAALQYLAEVQGVIANLTPLLYMNCLEPGADFLLALVG